MSIPLDFFDLDPKIKNNSYIKSYPHLISFFQKDTLNEADFVCGAHMVYGWMPTILDLYPLAPNQNFEKGAELLLQAKNGAFSDNDIETLKKIVNNSLIGASKLLHFVAPFKFPIWDTKTYAFYVLGKRSTEKINRPRHNSVNSIEQYNNFREMLYQITLDSRFCNLCTNVRTALGYKVSSLRTIELVMFNNSPDFNHPKAR
jgi:hypothetical protein